MPLREPQDIQHKGKTLVQILEAHARWALNEEEASSHADLAEAKLFNTNLRNAILPLANLTRADLHRSDLRQANLSQAELSQTDLRECQLQEARLPGAVLAGCQLHRADARGADLRDSVLDGSDIIGADLRGADFSGSSLARVRLYRSDLRGADLTKASLVECELVETKLAGARLHETVLKSAKLYGTDLRGCDIRGADFSSVRMDQAWLGHTRIAACDLSRVLSIETARHLGPTWLDEETLKTSKLPAAFLYGAGIANSAQPGRNPSAAGKSTPLVCMIAHAPRDAEFAERLRMDLMANGVRAWFLPEDVDWEEVALDRPAYDRLVLVCSRVGLASRGAMREMGRALDRESREKSSVLVTLRVDDALYEGWQHERKAELLRKPIWDFRSWKDRDLYSAALQRLLVAIVEGQGAVGRADSV